MEAEASEGAPDFIPAHIAARHGAAARRTVHRGCGLTRCPSRAAAWRPTVVRLVVTVIAVTLAAGLLLLAAAVPAPLGLALAVAAGLLVAWAAHPIVCSRPEEP